MGKYFIIYFIKQFKWNWFIDLNRTTCIIIIIIIMSNNNNNNDDDDDDDDDDDGFHSWLLWTNISLQ